VIRRRHFMTLLGGAAAAWPVAARAQQVAMPVIGVLAGGTPAGFAPLMAAFQRGLSEEGNFIEGQNVAIEYRWSESQNEQFPAFAADLVDRQVAVIATIGSTPAARAAKAATTTIPLVFYTAFDPVKIGLVSSLSRPGGNATGVTSLGVEVGGKRLELLHELMPTETSIGLLVNPTNTLTETLTKRLPLVMEVNPSAPAKTVPEFIAYAGVNPGKVSFASAGIGTVSHVSGELFKMMTGVNMVHVPQAFRASGTPER
jgi:putative tryptophan/tyrosine transport system substrate-binding protein